MGKGFYLINLLKPKRIVFTGRGGPTAKNFAAEKSGFLYV